MKEIITPIPVAKEKVAAPRFKGRTKIEIFEGGKKVSECIDTNMQTKMLEKIFNPKRLFSEFETANALYMYHTPMYSTVLGGLLLYEQPIEENAELTFAPISNRCIGHAGGTYGGAQSTRGTLNAAESGYIDPDKPWKGYRYVYDFGTDKANGIISCVCMSSQTGGASGYGKGIDYSVTENNYFIGDFKNLTTPSTYTNGAVFAISGTTEMYTAAAFAYLGESEDGFSRFVYLRSNSLLVLVEIKLDSLELNLADEVGKSGVTGNTRILNFSTLGENTPTYRINQYNLPFTLYSASRFSVCIKDGKWYIINHTSSTEFAYTIFDPDTKSFSGVQNRTVSPVYYYNGFNNIVKVGNYWFAIGSNNSTLYRYPDGGGTGETIITLTRTQVRECLQDIYGNLAYLATPSSNSNNNAYLKIIDPEDPTEVFAKANTGVNAVSITSSQFVDSDPSVFLRFFVTNSNGVIVIKALVWRLTGYLATINNLANPVTKTSAQTMKITYEIKPEGDE